MSLSLFGALRDGGPVMRATFGSDDLSVSVISLGAALHDLRLAGAARGRALVLGYPRVEDYTDRDFRTGAIVGRCANRIAGGRFLLDGRAYQLTLNDEGRRHLHGGTVGFSQRNWEIIDAGDAFVALRLVSEAGDQGYPGRLVTLCRYAVDGRRLSISLSAETDAPTIISLAPHGYFNLEGEGDVLGHRLQVAADEFTPVGADRIPTGEILPVAGQSCDFRQARSVGSKDAAAHGGHDVNFVLGRAPSAQPRYAAHVAAPTSGVAFELWTTEPGLQLYDAGGMLDAPPGHEGAIYPRFGGLCLEPQRFPDSPNHIGFTNTVLRPGEVYRQLTEYRFA